MDNRQTRRNFLKMAGIATATMAIPARVYPAQAASPAGIAEDNTISYQRRLNTGLLRLYDGFDPLPDGQATGFQYECSNPELDRLREKYRLDRVAGTGDDWSKAMNVLKWMTGHISHRGNIASALPDVCESLAMNAHGLMEYSFDKGKDNGISCYMLAITLTEIYLSIGLKSRMVSLNPLNPYDYDNHLVTIVWCDNFSKWVMVDPSYNAYLCDTEGNILNPWEVRDLLCRNKSVVCNAELSHNGVTHDPEDYLRYMAKNLFYMQSPTFTGFDSTTTSGKPWLILTPLHFDVCKREAYHMKWIGDGGNDNWENDELEELVKEWRSYLVCTSSVASFAQAPA